MEDWLQNLFWYLRPNSLYDRWTHESLLLMVLLFILFLEVISSGWKESSFGAIRSPRRTEKWEIFSMLAQASGLRKFLANFFFFGLVAYIGRNFGNYTLDPLADFSPWIRIPAAVLFYDFLMYWGHRVRHTNNWLWIVHDFHHSSTRVNSLTSYRAHPIDNLVFVITISLPFQIFFGLDLPNAVALTIFVEFTGVFSHARVDRDFGWIGRYVLVTPRFHHLHHALDKKMFTNYGHAFVFWDRIFRTYSEPSRPIASMQQGMEDNYYETMHPVKAFLTPVWRFYAYPFAWAKAKITRRSPAQTAGRLPLATDRGR